MSVFDRMSQIERKLNQLESRLEGGGIAPSTARPELTSGQVDSHPGVTFEHLVNTLSEKDRFQGGPVRKPSPIGAWQGDPKDYDAMISQASREHGVDEALIRAVIRQESGFNPKATSWAGAQGLMQLMPETAADLGVNEPYDPYQNIMGGATYLRRLMDQFDGNLTKVLAGYNAGPGNVEKYGGVPPFEETQNYVAAVLDNYRMYKEQTGGGTARNTSF